MVFRHIPYACRRTSRVVLHDFGAAILNIHSRRRRQKKATLFWLDKLEDYFDNPACTGMTVGPSPTVPIKQKFLSLGTSIIFKNDGPTKQNNLHTDLEHGLHKRLWDAEIDEEAIPSYLLRLDDGTFGLPATALYTHAIRLKKYLKERASSHL